MWCFLLQGKNHQGNAVDCSDEIMNSAEPKEKEIVKHILCGDSIDQISRDLHVSKKTIYGFFEKMRKKLK